MRFNTGTTNKTFLSLCVLLIILVFGPTTVSADVTYWLHSSVPSDVANSVQEAVDIYNKYGSFNKHLVVYWNAGVPTAQANYDGVITFGGSRNTRVALHEMGHTVGIGTYWGSPSYSSLMVGGVWQGYYGRTLGIEMGGYADGVHGDGTHIWPWGLNYDSEDGFMERIKHVRIMAAMRCDMGIMAYSQEAEHQTVPIGGAAIFTVASPLANSYQWYKDGTLLSNGGDISGANSAALQITNADFSDEGYYHCAATGAGETLNSRPRRLVIEQLVGRWNFENNANDSANSNHGTIYGSPTYTSGMTGQAISLDGSNDYVTLSAGVADTENLTIATWVYWNGGGNWQRIFDFGTSTSQYLFLSPSSGSNTLRFAIKDGDAEQVLETSQLATGQWVHLAVILRQDTATLYVNGRPVDTNPNVTIDPRDFSPNINYIGNSQFGADPLFNGRIDDFRIYNYALPGAEIWDLWGQSANNAPLFSMDPVTLPNGIENAPYTGQTLTDFADDPDGDPLTFSKISGPTWLNVASNGTLSGTPATSGTGENTFIVRITDPSGASDDTAINIFISGLIKTQYQFEGNLNDSIGASHGTATGTPVYTAGYSGQAIDLDGTDDYLTLPSGIANIENVTISAWVNWDGGNQWQRIFDFGNDTSQNMFLTPRSGGDTLRFAIKNGGSEQQLNSAQLPTDQWTHIAVTLSGNTGKLYVDGQLEDTNYAMTINPNDFNPANNYIGNSQWPDPLLNGRIDDFRIYHYAMSDTQISMLTTPPAFTSDPITNTDAIELEPYIGQPLSDFVDSPSDTLSLTFSKETGPVWLAVSPDGALSGFPANSDMGTNVFTVRVENTAGLFDITNMTIEVANVYSGVEGLTDLAGLADQWLMLDCVDSPGCNGADLNGDNNVDMSDLHILANNWLTPDDLIVHFQFEEMTGDVADNSSLYALSGLLINDPTWVSDSFGGALSFDGVDDYVEIAGYKGITEGASRTCAAWIKTTKTNSKILSWGQPALSAKWVIRTNSDGTLRAEVSGGYIFGTTNISDDSWHHVAVVLEDDGTPDISEVRLYVDGNLEVTGGVIAYPINTASVENVKVGLFLDGSGYFQGLIDEVRIYNRALTGTEITDMN